MSNGRSDSQDTGAFAKLERVARSGTLGSSQAQSSNPKRCLVRVTSVRKRLLDEDNLAEKYHIDSLRYAGLLQSDAPQQVRIETTQRLPEKGEAEHTLVEIYFP